MRDIEKMELIVRNNDKSYDVISIFEENLLKVASSTKMNVKKKILHEKVSVYLVNFDKAIKPITLMKIIDNMEKVGCIIYYITYKTIENNKYEIKIEMEALTNVNIKG